MSLIDEIKDTLGKNIEIGDYEIPIFIPIVLGGLVLFLIVKSRGNTSQNLLGSGLSVSNPDAINGGSVPDAGATQDTTGYLSGAIADLQTSFNGQLADTVQTIAEQQASDYNNLAGQINQAQNSYSDNTIPLYNPADTLTGSNPYGDTYAVPIVDSYLPDVGNLSAYGGGFVPPDISNTTNQGSTKGIILGDNTNKNRSNEKLAKKVNDSKPSGIVNRTIESLSKPRTVTTNVLNSTNNKSIVSNILSGFNSTKKPVVTVQNPPKTNSNIFSGLTAILNKPKVLPSVAPKPIVNTPVTSFFNVFKPSVPTYTTTAQTTNFWNIFNQPKPIVTVPVAPKPVTSFFNVFGSYKPTTVAPLPQAPIATNKKIGNLIAF